LAIEHIVKKSVSEDLLFKWIKKGKIFPELLYEIDADIDIMTAEEIRTTKNELFESKIYSIKENSRVFNFIREFSKEKKYHIWTNSNKYKVKKILEFNKYDDLFTTIISRDEVLNPKPNLEGIEIIKHKNSIKNNNLIVIDDSLDNINILNKKGYIAKHPDIFN
jgi:FMN phosphatase YigB (HAD superfamily)